MRFRSHLILTVFGVMLLVVGAIWFATVRILENSAQLRLGTEVERDLTAVTELLNTRRSILAGEVRVVAAEPRLKAITAAQEVTHETVYGVAAELKKALGSDVFLLTDADGVLLVDVADPKAEGFDMRQDPIIASALDSGHGEGVWTHDSHVFLVQSQRLAFGAHTAGVLVVGYDVAGGFLEAAHRQTGATVAFVLDGKVVGSASARGASITDALQSSVQGLPSTGHTAISIGGERFVAGLRSLPGYNGERSVNYAVFRSLDEAMAPARKLTRIIAWLTLAGMAVGLGLAFVSAHRLSRPLSQLVSFAKAIGQGDLKAQETIKGPLELTLLSNAMNAMARDLDQSQQQLVVHERLEREMEIARTVQLSILPKDLSVRGLKLAANMTTASEVGGDYYDVIANEKGAWIGIGDVAGHGLPAGLVMVMLQTCVSSLVRESPNSAPSELVTKVNSVIYDNVKRRLGQTEHVTFSLFRYDGAGKFVVAGAHEDFIIYRHRTQSIERIIVEGTWLGVLDDISGLLEDMTIQLEERDLLVLYTDGIIEARDDDRSQLDIGGLETLIRENADEDVSTICDRVFAAVREWGREQDDDETMVIIRYTGEDAVKGA